MMQFACLMRGLSCYAERLLKCTELESEPTHTAAEVLRAVLLPGLFNSWPVRSILCFCLAGVTLDLARFLPA